MSVVLMIGRLARVAAFVAAGVAVLARRRSHRTTPPARRRSPGPEPDRPRLGRRELRARLAAGDDLVDVDLRRSNLSGTDLTGRDLTGLVLARANLSRAHLARARLAACDLTYADLHGADLSGADLSGASVFDADLTRANLEGADLSSARGLVTAAVRNASYSSATRWPPLFDPEACGALPQRRPSFDT